MVTVKPKVTATLKFQGACLSHARTDVSTRDVEVTLDEPLERGGTNMGLSPVETLMAALIGCTNVISQKIAEARGIEIRHMSVDGELTFDRRGAILMQEVDVPFPTIDLFIAVTTDAGDDEIAALKADLPRFCPVSKVIRQGGTRINEIWTVTRP